MIRAIPITLSVEVGSTTLKLRDLMRLSQGSVLELDRGVGEPMMIKINDQVIAKGEIVAVGDKLGVSVVDIVAPLERVNQQSWNIPVAVGGSQLHLRVGIAARRFGLCARGVGMSPAGCLRVLNSLRLGLSIVWSN